MGVCISILGTTTKSGKTLITALLHHILPRCAPPQILNSLPTKLTQNILNSITPIFDFLPQEIPGPAVDLSRNTNNLTNTKGPAILVANAEKDDLHASIHGSLALLPSSTRSRIVGVIINKKQNPTPTFQHGLKQLEKATGVPILGVIPKIATTTNSPENAYEILKPKLDAAVITNPDTTDYRDAARLALHPAFGLRFVNNAESLQSPDLLILPQNTPTKAWFTSPIAKLAESGTPIINLQSKRQHQNANALPVSGRIQTLTGIYSCLSGINFHGFASPTPSPHPETNAFAQIDFGNKPALEGSVQNSIVSTHIQGIFGNEEIRARLAEELLRRKGEVYSPNHELHHALAGMVNPEKLLQALKREEKVEG